MLGAVEFIEQLRLGDRMALPGKVIVIGGGNTAMDAASESARLGAASVLLAYRRSKDEMGAYDFEYELAKVWVSKVCLMYLQWKYSVRTM